MPKTPEARAALAREIAALKRQVAAAEAQHHAAQQAQLVRTPRLRKL